MLSGVHQRLLEKHMHVIDLQHHTTCDQIVDILFLLFFNHEYADELVLLSGFREIL